MTYTCVAGTSWKHAVHRAGLAALAVVLLAAIGAMAVRSHGSAAPAQRASAAPARLPLAAQAPVSRALGRDDASYWVQRSAGGLQAVNRAQRLRAQFDRGSVLVSSSGVSLGLSLRAYGYGAALQLLPAVAARVAANQVVYVHAGVSEWYANGPLGLEQGFTVPTAPAGRHAGPLTLELGLSGDARGRLLPGADGVMFTGAGGALAYQGLVAVDARGRALPAWIEFRGNELLLRVAAADASYPIRVDPFVQQAKLTAADGAEFDALGTSVAISGDTIVVGAPSATVGSNFNQGAAYVFLRSRSGWANATQIAKLTAADGAASDKFGSSVAISGGTIVAGAPDATVGGNLDQGTAYVFAKRQSGWADGTQTAKLTAAGGATFDLLGTSVAISGDTIVAGAPGATVTGNAFQGVAYVFAKPRSGWANATQTAKLTANGAASDNFGSSVAIDGDTIVTGAPSPPVALNPDLGAVYVFVKPRSGWADATDTAKLTASDIVLGESFGSSVAISGGTVVAGAPDATVGGNLEQGAAYVFVKPRSGWADGTQTAKLTASDGASVNLLGLSIAISGDTVVAGADLATVAANTEQGAAYLFVKPGSGWTDATQTAKLTASDGASLDRLGTSVAIFGGSVVAGAPGATVNTNLFQGAAYVFFQEPRHG